MTMLMGRRSSAAAPTPVVDLAEAGIHRDPANHDPIATGTFAQRVANKASAMLGGRSSRRSFLTRTAVLGSALAVGPIDFILKPGTAYGYLCGTCSDGWTAFCCTINGGANSCPPYSFVAGWWKADNAAYCCGAARYIIDCNAKCPTQCSCRCAGGACDGRRTCCNQFRYGQCHTEISCYGPVVCRVATCTPPWRYDPSCTTSSATDNRTVEHGAPCISAECGTAISQKYDSLGGAGGFLGPIVTPEEPVGDGRGRRARYRYGNIYWTSTTGAHEVHGAILGEYDVVGGPQGIGYPTTDELVSSEGGRYSAFERGTIYFRPGIGTFTVSGLFAQEHYSTGGVGGSLGYPRARAGGDGAAYLQDFDRGRIYIRGGGAVHNVNGLFFDKFKAVGGPSSIGYPVADAGAIPGKGYYQDFEKGRIWIFDAGRIYAVSGLFATKYAATGGPNGPLGYPRADAAGGPEGRSYIQDFDGGRIHALAANRVYALSGAMWLGYLAAQGSTGPLGLPVADQSAVGDGRGTVGLFERGRIYFTATTGPFAIQDPILATWLNNYGGPTGSLGYATGPLDPPGTAGGRVQPFERGRLRLNADGSVTLLP